ncbi:MAG: response regulator [Chitinophagales bacterium]
MNTILIIEDNLEIRENTTEILELEGYEVISAANGKVGFDLACEKKPHLILCDILMPELNGYEVFELLKQDEETASIPFIFITASVEKSQVQMGLSMGADGYLRKPFETIELLEMVAMALHRSSAM